MQTINNNILINKHMIFYLTSIVSAKIMIT